MPIVKSEYISPFKYRNAHIQTVLPTLFRKVHEISYIRQRINTMDGDFIDLDWSCTDDKADSLAVLCHGLEGCSDRAYMMGMAAAFNRRRIDAVAYNYRGCSGEPNLRKKFYTAGATDDLDDVLASIKKQNRYQKIFLVGFSLGANLVLKYAGEKGRTIDSAIKGAAAISSPCDLRSSSLEMQKFKNYFYNLRFLKMLFNKIRDKAAQHNELQKIDLKSIRNFKDFDDNITAPLNGFKDAEDYWHQSSCSRCLHKISIPALVLNAADDPILGLECYPYQEADSSDFVFLEVPQWGGHVGFMHRLNNREYWHETRTANFLLGADY